MIILIPKMMSQFQVTTKMILIKPQAKLNNRKDNTHDNPSKNENESSSSDRKNESYENKI